MFIPPHCPNPSCVNYYHPARAEWYRFFAFYHTKAFGRVPRFCCKECRKTFSSQTFSIDYYVKKPLDYTYIFNQINAAAGLRNIARNLKVRHKAIRNRINRMARNAVLSHQQILHRQTIIEDLVADGFESFCKSQYHPDNFTLVVGKASQFVYLFDYSHLRRKGRMREEQKRKREEIERFWRPSPKALEKSFGELCRWIIGHTEQRRLPLILYTDEKKDYIRALTKDQMCREAFFSGRIRHHRTNSQEGRNRSNPLFPANYIDREIRKDVASHARESVQFQRNVNEGVLRLNLYLYEHNYMKPYRIKEGLEKGVRHSDHAGIDRCEVEGWVGRFFRDRFFWRIPGFEGSGAGIRALERGWETPLRGGKEKVVKHLAA